MWLRGNTCNRIHMPGIILSRGRRAPLYNGTPPLALVRHSISSVHRIFNMATMLDTFDLAAALVTWQAPYVTLYHGQHSFSSWPYRPNSASY